MKVLKLGERKAQRIKGYEALNDAELCYWRVDDGTWLLYLPGCGLGGLANHHVVENDDGTITVSPSILTTGHDSGEPVQVHGFLTNGVWRDA